jgi:hypothetical protein
LCSYHPAKFAKIWISVEKFKFSQILLGDKNATSLCSKNISTLDLSCVCSVSHASGQQALKNKIEIM